MHKVIIYLLILHNTKERLVNGKKRLIIIKYFLDENLHCTITYAIRNKFLQSATAYSSDY